VARLHPSGVSGELARSCWHRCPTRHETLFHHDRRAVQLFVERVRWVIPSGVTAQKTGAERRGKAEMTDDQLAEELYQLKRRNEAPISLIEMLDALLSLDPNLNAKQKRKRSYEIMARALERLERKNA
jgi:hypothetical protein